MKKTISLMMCIVLLLSIFVGAKTKVLAAGDTIGDATAMTFGQAYEGSITAASGKDVYRLTLEASGCIGVQIQANIYRSSYYLYDADGKELWNSKYNYWDETIQQLNKEETFDLIKGTYYFCISEEYGDTGNYTIKTTYTDSKESFTEEQKGHRNDTIATAEAVTLGETYVGQIALNDDVDLYKLELTASACIELRVQASIYRSSYYLYDADGKELWNSKYNYWDDATQQLNKEEAFRLNEGIYYFCVGKEYGDTGNYQIEVEQLLLGDVDFDGKVTASDALEVLKSVVGKVTLTKTQKQVADLIEDSSVDATDALQILKVVVGKA